MSEATKRKCATIVLMPIEWGCHGRRIRKRCDTLRSQVVATSTLSKYIYIYTHADTYLQLLSHLIIITFYIENYILAMKISNIMHEVAPQLTLNTKIIKPICLYIVYMWLYKSDTCDTSHIHCKCL